MNRPFTLTNTELSKYFNWSYSKTKIDLLIVDKLSGCYITWRRTSTVHAVYDLIDFPPYAQQLQLVRSSAISRHRFILTFQDLRRILNKCRADTPIDVEENVCLINLVPSLVSIAASTAAVIQMIHFLYCS